MWHLFHTPHLVDDTATEVHNSFLQGHHAKKGIHIVSQALTEKKHQREAKKSFWRKNIDFSEKSELAIRSKRENRKTTEFCNILVPFSVRAKKLLSSAASKGIS